MSVYEKRFYSKIDGSYVDLSNLVETNHSGTASIENLKLSSYFNVINQSNIVFTTVAYPVNYINNDKSVGFLSGKYIDLASYFSDALVAGTKNWVTWTTGGIYGSGSKALLAGYLPLSPSALVPSSSGSDPYTTSYCIKQYTDSGSVTRTYKLVRDSINNKLLIKYLDKPAADIKDLASWNTAATWKASDFPGGVLPYRVYVQIQAGGGGGGNRSGGGGGGYWAGIVSTTAGTQIQMGASGAASTDAAASYIMNEDDTALITINGGKAGGSSNGGSGGSISYGVHNGDKYTAYAWTSTAVSGAKGGDDSTGLFDGTGNNGGNVSSAKWNIAGGYLSTYTNHTKLTSQSGGTLQENWGGSGGGASFIGNGGKGGAGNLGSKTIYNYGVAGGPGHGGGGGGKGNATDRGATGGNWWISISY